MEFEEVIKARRSVRRYEDKPIEEEKIAMVLEAARLAPSWENGQCWRFIVVRDKEIIKELTAGYNDWAKAAPILIVACGDPERSGVFNEQMYYMVDVAIAMEHLVLEASNLGLGTCWLGLFDERKVKELLKIPDEVRVVALTPLCYPKGAEGIRERIIKIAHASKNRKSIEEIVYDGEWGKPFGEPTKRK